MWVRALAIGHREDRHFDAFCEGSLDETSCAEHLIIGVGGNDDDSLLLRVLNGARPRSLADVRHCSSEVPRFS